MSGTTSAESESIGNSCEFSYRVHAFSSGDAALEARDGKTKRADATVPRIDNVALSGLSEVVSPIENAISWNDVDQQVDENEEYYQDDVEERTGDDDIELEESAYKMGHPTDHPELLEQIDGNLEDADASASHVYASASRNCKQHVGCYLL